MFMKNKALNQLKWWYKIDGNANTLREIEDQIKQNLLNFVWKYKNRSRKYRYKDSHIKIVALYMVIIEGKNIPCLFDLRKQKILTFPESVNSCTCCLNEEFNIQNSPENIKEFKKNFFKESFSPV